MSPTLSSYDHVLMARGTPTGTIAGATVGAVVVAILALLCSLPFLLKCRRKRRLRKRQEQDALRPEMATSLPGTRPTSQVFPPHANRLSRMSQGRLASAAATLSDHDSHTGKDYGPDGITFHQSPAPSPALIGKTLRTCSPAPSVIMAPSSASLAAASRKNSPAVAHGPFSPPPEKETMSRADTFGTLTTEPGELSRSPTGSQHGSQSPTIGGAFRKFHDKVFHHRDSMRSSGSESRKAGNRSPDVDVDMDELDRSLTDAPSSFCHDKPVMGGLAEEYYLGGPLSPPEETQVPETHHFINLMTAERAAPDTQQRLGNQQQNKLGSPFDPSEAPLSPTSPFVKDEELSSEEGGKRSLEAKSDTLSPPPRGLPASSPRGFEPPPSPSHPAPGTVNPMDMMRPTTDAEHSAWVETELWKLENSPSPQIDKLPSPQPEPNPPFQPTPSPQPQPQSQLPAASQQPLPQQQEPSPTPERPQFQAVVRHPTEMDLTAHGHVAPQHEEEVITDISDTSSPGPGYDQYAYGPSPPDHNSPETRLTDTGSPSPRSSMNSNRPASSYGGTDYLGTTPGGHSRNSSLGDASPKPTSFACEQCGSKFDQVHKLKYVAFHDYLSPAPVPPPLLSNKTYLYHSHAVPKLTLDSHHKRYHERPHQCPQCDKRFGTKTHLDRHINDKHNKTRKYHCTVSGCAYAKQGGGKSFPRKDNWRRHMQNKHSVQNPPEPVEEDVMMQEAI